VAGSFGCDNEPSGYLKGGEILDQLIVVIHLSRRT
jgi:hypothetical protein